MGPLFWKPSSEFHLNPCSERRSDSCDLALTDGCCGVVACIYCVQWDPYNGIPHAAPARFEHTGWVSDVIGPFFGFWERGYESGECEFVVQVDGTEVFRQSCYDGISCRDSSGSVSIMIGYDDGVLSWTKLTPIALPLIDDPDNPGCKTRFCGNCECTCECLCVSIVEPYTGVQCSPTELCSSGYACDTPRWYGTVTCMSVDYEVELVLGRDSYGDCVMHVTVNGEEQTVLAGECGNWGNSVELYDGTILRFACKLCDCFNVDFCECDGRCDPLVANTITSTEDPTDLCDNPLPVNLAIDIEATPSDGSDTCFTGSGGLTYKTPITGGSNCWEGTVSGTCTDCNGALRNWSLTFVMCCEGGNSYSVRVTPGTPAVIVPSENSVISATATSCDPFLLEGCTGEITAFVIACLGTMPPSPGTTYAICFQIYEMP